MSIQGDGKPGGNFIPGYEQFLDEVLEGLRKEQKELPTKYLYDKNGSQLFERICLLDEYYVPDVEDQIVRSNITEITDLLGPKVLLIEFGSGSCQKIRFLLDHLDSPAGYVPIDISEEQLMRVTAELTGDYPELELLPVCGDYTGNFEIPPISGDYHRKIVYFPGSTIGNFTPSQAILFLKDIKSLFGNNGGLLIGFDLKKDLGILNSAYNDNKGVTAAFNLNLLHRLNRELGSNFRVELFDHYAFYNQEEGRIEMHLVSSQDQSVKLNGETIDFKQGETIWTESSYKYTTEEFRKIAILSGLSVNRVWTDDDEWFGVMYLESADL